MSGHKGELGKTVIELYSVNDAYHLTDSQHLRSVPVLLYQMVCQLVHNVFSYFRWQYTELCWLILICHSCQSRYVLCCVVRAAGNVTGAYVFTRVTGVYLFRHERAYVAKLMIHNGSATSAKVRQP